MGNLERADLAGGEDAAREQAAKEERKQAHVAREAASRILTAGLLANKKRQLRKQKDAWWRRVIRKKEIVCLPTEPPPLPRVLNHGRLLAYPPGPINTQAMHWAREEVGAPANFLVWATDGSTKEGEEGNAPVGAAAVLVAPQCDEDGRVRTDVPGGVKAILVRRLPRFIGTKRASNNDGEMMAQGDVFEYQRFLVGDSKPTSSWTDSAVTRLAHAGEEPTDRELRRAGNTTLAAEARRNLDVLRSTRYQGV